MADRTAQGKAGWTVAPLRWPMRHARGSGWARPGRGPGVTVAGTAGTGAHRSRAGGAVGVVGTVGAVGGARWRRHGSARGAVGVE